MKKQQLTIEQFGGYFLLLCIIFLLLMLYRVLEPFVIDLILAALLSSVFYAIYKWFLKITRGHNKIASFLTCLFIVFAILIPIGLFAYQFIIEAVSAAKKGYTSIESGALDPLLQWKTNGIFASIRESLLPFIDLEYVDLNSFNIKATITEALTNTATFLGTQITEIATRTAFVIFHFSIMIISMFFMFKDSDAIVKKIMHLSPLPTRYNETVFQKFKEIGQATLFGIFLTALIQGFLGGIGFFIAGLPSPIFWGTLMALFALIPFLGTFIVWLPAAIYLLLTNQVAGGVFLLIWGAFVVSTIDNFLRPYFIHGRARTYPLLIFLTILGGLSVYGLVGIILGPLILALCFVFINIYEIEYHGVLHLKDRDDKSKKSLIARILKNVIPKS